MAYPTAATFLRTIRCLRPLALALAAGCATSACAGVSKLDFGSRATVDPSSPLAAEVQAASRAKEAYPRFADVPPAPTDVRPASAWSRNIYDTLQLRRQQSALAALYPQTLFGTDAWAKATRAEAVAPPTPREAAAVEAPTEAYAKSLRERATPPPPAH
jgi:hypothetical protein